jgi:hypothetical protein
LPKALREALEFLPSNRIISQITAAIYDQLVLIDPDVEAEAVPRLDLDFDSADIEWSEGVEELKDKTVDELWDMLGCPNKQLPFFNQLQDVDGSHDPWVEAEKAWFSDSKNVEPLVPRWHQLVGILKMVKNAFCGRPVLLMDSVGLGKTLQITGAVAVLAFYREYYKKHGFYPGMFGEWNCEDPLLINDSTSF